MNELLTKRYKELNINNTIITLKEFIEYMLKHTKFKFLYDQWDKVNLDKKPFIGIKDNKLKNIIIYTVKHKVCTRCKINKPINEYYKDSTKKDKLTRQCKACKNKTSRKYNVSNKDKVRLMKKKYREDNRESIKEYKEKYREANKEQIAKQTKGYREANKEKLAKLSKIYQETHKEQIIEYRKKYHLLNKDILNNKSSKFYYANKEELLKKQQLYHQNNKEYINQRSKEHYQAHKDEIAICAKKYREANKEQIAKHKKEYYQTEAGKISKSNSEHKRRELKKEGDVTKEQMIELRKATSCYWCGTPIKDKVNMHTDHVMPLSKGGKHTISNIVATCVTCNLTKGSRLPEEFADWLYN